MKTLIVKQEKLIQLRDKFDVLDERDNPVYHIEGTLVRIPKQIKINNLQGEQLATLTVKFISLLPTIYVDILGERVATIKKKLSILKAKYEVEGSGLTVKGDLMDMNFEIFQNGDKVGYVDKEWMTLKDIYAIHIDNEQDELLILAVVMAIQNAKQINRDSVLADD